MQVDSPNQGSEPIDTHDKPIQIAVQDIDFPSDEPTVTPVAEVAPATLPPESLAGEPAYREVLVSDTVEIEADQPEERPEEVRPEDANRTATPGGAAQKAQAGRDVRGERTTGASLDFESAATTSTEQDEASRDTGIESSIETVGRRQRPSRREPRKYEGLAGRPPKPRDDDRHGPSVTVVDQVERERALSIEVRLRFDRAGFCSVSLIPNRSPGLPEDVTVAVGRAVLDLRAMQDEWYQDVVPEDIARLLREGMVWLHEAPTGTWRWSLSGRELYVLGERTDLSGWVSQPSLQLGRKHAVLCTGELRPAAEAALRAAGVESPVALDASLGAPAGWVIFRDVVPLCPVSRSAEADILNALRPEPEIEIGLEGGIRLEHATWLEGRPPLVRVYGDPAHTREVLIDGSPAARGEDGAYRAPDWDAAGTHTVWCEGTSKSYSIVPFAASWTPWDAYSFPAASRSNRRLSICGPLVRESSANEDVWIPAFQLPETHTVLLGAAPGEYLIATRASGTRGSAYLASPPFRPVWALPVDPLHCSKTIVRISLVGEAAEPVAQSTRRRSAVDAWCRAILDASRKGLATEPDTEGIRALWLLYKHAARRIWRSRK